MKNLPLTFGAAFQITKQPPIARNKENLMKLANAITRTEPPETGTNIQLAESMLRISDLFVH